MSKKKKKDHEEMPEEHEGQPKEGEKDEPSKSEVIEPDHSHKAKAESDFAEHPKFSKFKGEKK